MSKYTPDQLAAWSLARSLLPELLPGTMADQAALLESHAELSKLSAPRDMDPDERSWCSQIDSDDERVYGPFDSREEAIMRAEEERDDREADDSVCTVGRCEYADPGTFLLDSRVETMLETLDEDAYHNEFCWVESEVFKLRDEDNGMRRLIDGLRAVLRRNLTSDYFVMADDARETVALPPRKDDDDENA